MPHIRKPAPASAQYERIQGGAVIVTNAPEIGLVNIQKTQYVRLRNFGSVEERTFYVSADAYICIEEGYNIQVLPEKASQRFAFEQIF